MSPEFLAKVLNAPKGVEVASVRVAGPSSQIEIVLVDPGNQLPDGEFGFRMFEVDGRFGVSLRDAVPIPAKGQTRGEA